MGLILRPSEIESGVQQIRSELNNMKDGYSGVMQTVLGFSGNEALQSQSWNRAKERIQEIHQCIVQGMWAAQTLMEKDLDSLEASMDGAEDLEQFLGTVIEHARYVLSQTPEMLPVLKQAGVVDSGGQGLEIGRAHV